jgi:predicted heme/steroid binding protein
MIWQRLSTFSVFNDGKKFSQFYQGGKMTQQAFNDEFSGQELFEDFESIGVKKVGEAKLDLEEA